MFVPLTTGSLRLFGQRFLRTHHGAVDDVAQIDATQDAVTALLRSATARSISRSATWPRSWRRRRQTQNTLTILLGSIAAISLLVGGIGVMNIMLVSVTERTREIGIRMATGARMRNILQQFLTEALVVSASAALIGVAGGLAAAGCDRRAWHADRVFARAGAARVRLRVRHRARVRLHAGAQGGAARPGRGAERRRRGAAHTP